MIRAKFINTLNQCLNTQYFSEYDFTIKSSRPYSYVTVEITYNYIPKYTFLFEIPNEKNSPISVTRKPGEITESENVTISSQDKIYREISSWLQAIREEMDSTPHLREYEEIKKRFSTLEEKCNQVPEEYFSKVEAEELKQKLEKLADSFEEKLKQEQDSKEDLEKEISAMKKDIELLKEQVDVFNKRNWLKSFGTRVFEWGQKHPTVTALLAVTGASFLPQEITEHIPTEEIISVLLPGDQTPTNAIESEITEPANTK